MLLNETYYEINKAIVSRLLTENKSKFSIWKYKGLTFYGLMYVYSCHRTEEIAAFKRAALTFLSGSACLSSAFFADVKDFLKDPRLLKFHLNYPAIQLLY